MPGHVAYNLAERRDQRTKIVKRFFENKPQLEQTRYIQENLDCSLEIHGNCIPKDGGKVTGILALEAMKEVKHIGIVILLKGNDQWVYLKFAAIETGEVTLEPGTKYTHNLEREIEADKLPIPFITTDGKFIYKLEVYCNTVAGWQVPICKKVVRWMGKTINAKDEEKAEIGLEMKVDAKRGKLGLKKGKEVIVKWKIRQGAYAVGEEVSVEMCCETKDKDGVEVEGKVELLQTILYQEHTPDQEKVLKKMRQVVLGECVLGGEVGKWNSGTVFEGKIKLPKGITSSIKFNLYNSVGYALVFKVRLKGEVLREPGFVEGELPLIVESGTGGESLEDELREVSGDSVSLNANFEESDMNSWPDQAVLQRTKSISNMPLLQDDELDNANKRVHHSSSTFSLY